MAICTKCGQDLVDGECANWKCRPPIKYLHDTTSFKVRERPCKSHGQNAQSYGRKISTGYIIQIGSRWHRVYATCYSNAASYWVMYRGEQWHLTESDFFERDVCKK